MCVGGGASCGTRAPAARVIEVDVAEHRADLAIAEAMAARDDLGRAVLRP
jgi:hypothetical protein